MKKFQAIVLQDWLQKILMQFDTSFDTAQKVAASLITNELMGYKSHGVMRMLHYVKDIENDLLDVNAKPISIWESEQLLHVEGQRAFGILVVEALIEQLKKTACHQMMVAARVTNAHHIGRFYPIGLHLADEPHGFFVLGFCNYLGTGARVALPASNEAARLCTNPLLFAFPVKNSAPFVLDMSTSTVAEGTVAYASLSDETLPEGVLINRQGKQSTNPHDLYSSPPQVTLSSLGHPLVSHKGYGLAVFVETIVGVLAGAAHIAMPNLKGGNGLFLLLINPKKLNPEQDSAEMAATIVRHCYESSNAMRYPGQKSYADLKISHNETITLPEIIYQKLNHYLTLPQTTK